MTFSGDQVSKLIRSITGISIESLFEYLVIQNELSLKKSIHQIKSSLSTSLIGTEGFQNHFRKRVHLFYFPIQTVRAKSESNFAFFVIQFFSPVSLMYCHQGINFTNILRAFFVLEVKVKHLWRKAIGAIALIKCW